MRTNALNHTVFDTASLPLIEATFAQFQANPTSVSPEWQAYFSGWLAAGSSSAGQGTGTENPLALGAYQLVQAWRAHGHTAAHLNPLAPAPSIPASLQPSAFGLNDVQAQVPTFGVLPTATASVAELFAHLQRTYSTTTGIEIAAITHPTQRAWAQQWWENAQNHAPAPARTRAALLRGLVQAGGLERFLHTKFVGAKRFSVEGLDVVIPMLQQLTEVAGAQGVKHMVMGMAHRGRLNVLVNILHKSRAELFAAFADKLTTENKAGAGVAGKAGDVKYHLGKTYVQTTAAGHKVELELLYNPSHLEAVNPAVLGVARAKAVRGGLTPAHVLPILMHGDSAVIGQGVVAETNNLSQLPAYTVGGTLHVVLNNQVGFTGNPAEVVSGAPHGAYCTDGFKALGIPVVHVNADDTDAVWRAAQFCFAFRQQWGTDVALDIIGYRRWGHNEGDDPTFTQPLMYEVIRPHPLPDAIYSAKLVAEGVLTQANADAIVADNAAELAADFATAQQGVTVKVKVTATKSGDVTTATSPAALAKVADAFAAVPTGVVVNPKVQKVIDERMAALRGTASFNWGAAEVAAYGTLLQQGLGWRLTGQDVQRGTFSHRHAALVDQRTDNTWYPLATLAVDGAVCEIANSALSENAVLGFEYGYSLPQVAAHNNGAKPTLTCWEAQFGDFANGAQVVIDQFIASAEVKWGVQSALTVMLPHGYEGQGPEHSSARLERFLQLCADDNLRVAVPTTPAQMFHLLRRQALHPVAKPLIVFTPKSLLRNPLAVSVQADLTQGTWQPVIADALTDKKKVKRVVLCSGKVYYDLLTHRTQHNREDVAIIRLEELYPWPTTALAQAMEGYKVKDALWVQEEPRNAGAWSHVRECWNASNGYLHYVGRPASASPAVGTTPRHAAEQAQIITEVFGT